MTTELREAIALTPWGPVKVKKEEEEDKNFICQASSQQVHSQYVKVWAPREGPQAGCDVSEEEEKVSDGFVLENLKYKSGALLHFLGLSPLVLWNMLKGVPF
jgi:hypothetical protein|uniref:Uncharacterized protein n=1 Tax=Castor canadensis TaxID=51338 RepID=A0A8C0WL18_CASCN